MTGMIVEDSSAASTSTAPPPSAPLLFLLVPASSSSPPSSSSSSSSLEEEPYSTTTTTSTISRNGVIPTTTTTTNTNTNTTTMTATAIAAAATNTRTTTTGPTATGTNAIRRVITNVPLSIGRKISSKNPPKESNGVFDSKVLSRQHAVITREDDEIFCITDLGSSNGTFVDDQPLIPNEKTPLRHMQRITFGVDIYSETGSLDYGKVDVIFMLASELDMEDTHSINDVEIEPNPMDASKLANGNGNVYADMTSILKNELELQRQTHAQLSTIQQITATDLNEANHNARSVIEVQRELRKIQMQQQQQQQHPSSSSRQLPSNAAEADGLTRPSPEEMETLESKYQAQLKSLQDTLEEYKKVIQHLEATIEETKRSSAADVKLLTEQYDEVKLKHQSSNESLRLAQEDRRAVEQKLLDFAEQEAALQESLVFGERSVALLLEELNNSNAQLSSVRSEADSLRVQLRQLRTSFEQRISALVAQQEDKVAALLKDRWQSLEDRVASLQQSWSQYQSTSQEKHQKLARDYERLETEHEKLKSDHEKSEAARQKLDDVREKTEIKLERLEAEHERLEQSHADLEKKHKTLREDHAKLETDSKKLEADHKIAQRKNASLKSRNTMVQWILVCVFVGLAAVAWRAYHGNVLGSN